MDLHHILEIITTKSGEDGDYGKVIINTRDKLKELGLYGSRSKHFSDIPSWQLCECTHSDHIRLHAKFRKWDDETKKKMRKTHKGKVFSEEHRNHISEVRKSIASKAESLEELTQMLNDGLITKWNYYKYRRSFV